MYGYSTYRHQDPNVRAGDADRDEIGERLRRHHAEGRIDPEEFQERIDRCYQAKTMGELQQLVGDLPHEHEEHLDRPLRLGRMWWLAVIPFLIVTWAISMGTGWHHQGHWGGGPWGLLWLIPLFFLVRFLLWPYGRRGMRRRYRFPRDL